LITVFEYIAIATLGLIVGSFLNVCIWRMPRGQSIISPASRCPSCGTPIRAWENIPVLSYVFLRGRCRYCKTRISARYPLVEALNGLLYVLALYRFEVGWHLPFYLALVSSLIVITFIDLDFQIIPDRITLTWIPVGLLAGSLLLPDPFMRAESLGWQASLSGAASGFGLFYAVALLSRGGMGGGDIKMMSMVGALMGWRAVLLTTFIGSLVGSVLGVFLMVAKGKGRKTKIPFGPFLAGGALLTLFLVQEIMEWYLGIRI
jgi:leader peptidase (prepilin peptidase)/N-methyltransferase